LANKLVLALLLALVSARPAREELLRLSLLDKPAGKFTVRMDIFNGAPDAGAAAAVRPTPAQAAEAQRSIAEEIFQSVIYEGFVVKDARELALLNVSGEYHMVGPGDDILGKIKILSVSRAVVVIEYEGQAYDIRIKGE
jgi:hypothetical protein